MIHSTKEVRWIRLNSVGPDTRNGQSTLSIYFSQRYFVVQAKLMGCPSKISLFCDT